VSDLPSLEVPAIAELATWRRWVLWRREERAGKVTKIPITPTGSPASTTRPATWSTFADVIAAYVAGIGDGIGFVFTDTPFVGIDLDGVIDSGGIQPWAQEIVAKVASYTETSPSGRGLHVIARGSLPGRGRKRGPLEVYDHARYFTVSGKPWPGAPETIEDREAAIETLYNQNFSSGRSGSTKTIIPSPTAWDGTLPAAVEMARGVDLTLRLLLSKRDHELGYGSESEADFALACTLLEHGFTAADAEAALRWRHRHVATRPKWVGYFPLTVSEAQGAISKKKGAAR
jgi:putative DNA primase/helicase